MGDWSGREFRFGEFAKVYRLPFRRLSSHPMAPQHGISLVQASSSYLELRVVQFDVMNNWNLVRVESDNGDSSRYAGVIAQVRQVLKPR